MKIKKGTLLEVNDDRKGRFIAVAIRDFDTEKEEFYPVAVAQEKTVRGKANDWEEGEKIPCRNILCTVKLYEPKAQA